MQHNRSRAWTISSIVLAVLLWGGFFAAIAQRQALQDWWKLRGYTPPASVVAIADENMMTDYGRHLFYVNKPTLIGDRASFTKACPLDVEKTIVLGCYRPVDDGIYLFAVQDERLDGVVEVTAAHEMLHAAYERLSAGDKQDVDAMLLAYYQNDLTDERLRKTFQAYEKSGADITNELHSILGTEVPALPANLETYYKQYFANRQAVTDAAARYEAEFTSREEQVAEYDAQLAVLKQQIDQNETQLERQLSQLQSLEATMNTQKANDDIAGYNANVARYNILVDAYNKLLNETKQKIEQYNILVEKRNAIASEEQSLVQALSGSGLPSEK